MAVTVLNSIYLNSKGLQLDILIIKKLVGRAESIHCRESGVIASAITPPGVLKTRGFCEVSTEVRDRTLARAVPRSI